MLLKILLSITLVGYLFLPAVAGALPPQPPFRIGGLFTVNGTQVNGNTDTGYKIIVTREDLTEFKPAAEDKDGLNTYNWYNIDVPTYNATDQPTGAKPGDILIIHVYKDNSKLLLTSPFDGHITAGNKGDICQIDIEALTGPTHDACYTKAQLDEAVNQALIPWDMKGDRKIGLEEAINALQIVSGQKTGP
jgi:hypothetical protein